MEGRRAPRYSFCSEPEPEVGKDFCVVARRANGMSRFVLRSSLALFPASSTHDLEDGADLNNLKRNYEHNYKFEPL